MKLTTLKLEEKQRQGGRGCLTHIEDFPYLNLCIYVYWSWNKGEDFMLNISYSSVFVDSSGDNSLYAVCSRLEICTVHWVSLVPGYLWSCYLHFSCQQEKKLLSLFSWMWELTNFFFFKMFNDLFSSIQSVTIFHHLTKFTENIYEIN